MNHDRVQIFREKLDKFAIADYHGLNSPGLTCYLNSVLQVLFMTEDFRGSVKRCSSKDSTTIDTLLGELFDDLEKGSAKTHSFLQNLGITDVYEQRDAAEYFEKILCLTSPEASKIFKGEVNHKATCVKCKEGNDSRNFFWILPLAMENSYHQIYSVGRGLKAFFKKEKVYGDNKMYCDRCNKKRDADIDCEMTHTPEILTLLLKRFTFDHKRLSYVKLHCEADVPQTLHMENCRYDLYALVHHFGNLTGGHYTAEIKSFETGEWYCFDDDIVERVRQPLFGPGNSSVRSRTAYLLVYRKESTHSEVDQEAQQTQLDVEAEGGCDETERGEALAHHLKDEIYSGDENVNHLNGDVLKNSYDDTVCEKQADSSWEVEKQPNRRAASVRAHKNLLPQTDTDAKKQKDGGHNEPKRQELNTNSELITAPCVASMFEQNHDSVKKRLKPDDISWDGTGQDSIATMTRTKPKHVTDSIRTRSRANPAETIGVRNKRGVATEEGIEKKSTVTQEATQTVTKGAKTVSLRTTKATKRKEEKVKKVPWR
ncbi:ubiquitin carboxyl-terminal hydrolase 46-like [Trachinotus anak]|uniref:ubiquitin carboxyl-terminal hydrolase 46-like n=1 Tax=Trachinotus anak TaxID=443729 RepID=UPI0039F2481F